MAPPTACLWTSSLQNGDRTHSCPSEPPSSWCLSQQPQGTHTLSHVPVLWPRKLRRRNFSKCIRLGLQNEFK